MSPPKAPSGRCLCGAVTFVASGDLKALHCCHCRDCARWNGGPLMAAEFEGGFAIEGPVRWFQSSDWAERGSCEVCGSALFWRMREGAMMNAAAGAFDDPSIFEKIESHIFIDSKPPFYDFADDAPRLTAEQVIEAFKGASAP